jgi:hypothetical protein
MPYDKNCHRGLFAHLFRFWDNPFAISARSLRHVTFIRYLTHLFRQGQQQITTALRGTTNGWVIDLREAHGKNLMPTPFTNSMMTSQLEVYSCDLNGDNQHDFIVNVWSGGCGLAADGSEVTFLLSGKDGYRATSFYLYAFGNEDLVRFNAHGPVYFIFNDLIGNDGEKTRDGRNHNFWVYNLNRIDGNRFVSADGDQSGFPRPAWPAALDRPHPACPSPPHRRARCVSPRFRSP